MRITKCVALMFGAAWFSAWGGVGLRPVDLRTEYLTDPAALDVEKPRLQWRLEADERGDTQMAYRVFAADSEAALAGEKGNVWDSGRVNSAACTQIEFGGKPLASRQGVWWKVMVWDRQGRASAWSKPARWRMGLLKAEDWSAQWIAFRDATALHASTNLFLPPARHYRREFELKSRVRRAMVYATALGLYELELNGRRVGDAWFTPGWTDYRRRVYYQAWDVTAALKPGANAMGAIVADGWYAGYVAYGLLVGYGPNKTGRNIYGKTPALRVQLEIECEDGSREIVGTDGHWRVTGEGPIREADLLMGESYDARREFRGWASPGFDDHAWKRRFRRRRMVR